jgi:hypothetical protein
MSENYALDRMDDFPITRLQPPWLRRLLASVARVPFGYCPGRSQRRLAAGLLVIDRLQEQQGRNPSKWPLPVPVLGRQLKHRNLEECQHMEELDGTFKSGKLTHVGFDATRETFWSWKGTDDETTAEIISNRCKQSHRLRGGDRIIYTRKLAAVFQRRCQFLH